MKPFIQKCTGYLANIHDSTEDYVIVIPSKRAKKYIYESLAKAYNKPIFLPTVLTIEEFTGSWNTLSILDKTRQLFLLYKIVTTQADFGGLSFEEFLTWGPMVIDDFEEMNRHLLDCDKVFKNLISIKELESWNLEDGRELSESQQKFMAFWDILPDVYKSFEEALQKNNLTTPGSVLRDLAIHVTERIPLGKKYYFLGFNALTPGELIIIKALIQRGQADFWMDADRFYLDNPVHEAGAFLRKNIHFLSLEDPKFIGDKLTKAPIKIEVVACSQVTGQVKLAASNLSLKSKEELESTLVLLADESLIVPLMKNIPATVGKANITIGLPLKQTSIKTFVDILFSIQENKQRFKTEAAYFKDLTLFFQHPLIAIGLEAETLNKITQWERKTTRQNKVFQNVGRFDFHPTINELLQIAFTKWESFELGIQLIQKLTERLINKFHADHEFEKQQLLVFQEGLVSFSVLAEEGLPKMGLKTFKLFFNQHWAKKSIAFHGNPTKGLQIMGLLESRLLDFKELVVLGLNEGMLPPTNLLDSIIPMDLRRSLGMPTVREKQGLFAHHFYRLLHTAEKVTITYAIANETLGSSEPSRYLTQLEMELSRFNPNIEFTKKFYNTAFPQSNSFNSAIVLKRPQIHLLLDNYFSKNVSASAINKYLTCPLDFYYRYLAEFGEEDAVEEELESNSIGKFIHDTLEILYSPWAEIDKEGQIVKPPPPPLSEALLREMLTRAPGILKEQFLIFLAQEEKLIESGKNWLALSVAEQLVENLLLNDISYIASLSEPVFIHRVEAGLKAPMEILLDGEPFSFNWIGYVDRIDRVGNDYRLVDYKSGAVKPEHVTYLQKPEVVDSFKSCKHALQLAVYAFLFKYNYSFLPSSIGIYAIQKRTEAYHPLGLDKITQEEMLGDFHSLMEHLITEIFNLDLPFTHNPEAKYCGYC